MMAIGASMVLVAIALVPGLVLAGRFDRPAAAWGGRLDATDRLTGVERRLTVAVLA
jgi:hypothetical protein